MHGELLQSELSNDSRRVMARAQDGHTLFKGSDEQPISRSGHRDRPAARRIPPADPERPAGHVDPQEAVTGVGDVQLCAAPGQVPGGSWERNVLERAAPWPQERECSALAK